MAEALTYSKYLRLAELLSLQTPLSKPIAHDEHLFIVIHQVYELWFKEILYELDSLIIKMGRDEFVPCFRLFDRINEIFKVLIEQIGILETMTPSDFNRFRNHLNPASGFQSEQFRELEIRSGVSTAEYDGLVRLNPEWKAVLTRCEGKSTLRSALFSLFQRHQVLEATDSPSVVKAIVKIYQSATPPTLYHLCECLIRYDEQFSLWRFRHVQMVERMIGMKPGTGGSLGARYLQQTLKRRYFPELWEARTHMEGTGSY